MGKLKNVFFQCEPEQNGSEKVATLSIRPLNITLQEVLQAYGIEDSERTASVQCRANSWTKSTDKEPANSYILRGLQAEMTTGVSNYGKKVERKNDTRRGGGGSSSDVDEWLSDYGLG